MECTWWRSFIEIEYDGAEIFDPQIAQAFYDLVKDIVNAASTRAFDSNNAGK